MKPNYTRRCDHDKELKVGYAINVFNTYQRHHKLHRASEKRKKNHIHTNTRRVIQIGPIT